MLLSQEQELGELELAMAESEERSGQVVLVEAPVGCGKSELITTFTERAAERGAVVLSAAGLETDRDKPFSVLRRLSGNVPSLAVAFHAENDGVVGIDAVRDAWLELLRGSAGTSVLCCVDDLHYADAASLEGLRQLIRLSRTAPVLVVLSQTTHFALQDSDFSTELLRMPNVRHIQLSRFDDPQVAGVIGGYPDLASQAADHAGELVRASGGNPLLLRALIAELRNSSAGVLTAGGPFAQAVLTCARRSSWHGRRLAAAVAILGEYAGTERLAELLGITTSAAAQGLAALVASGVIGDLEFRHPVGRIAVLDSLPRDELAALYRRAAELLHAIGAMPHLADQHLAALFADRAIGREEPWVVEVLCSAAEQALAGDDTEQGIRLLEHAHAASPDPQRRGEIKTRLAAVTWRTAPARSEQHLDNAFETLRGADASPQSMWPLAQLLVAQGRITDAIEIRNLTIAAGGSDEVSAGALPWGRLAGEAQDEASPFAMTESHQFTALDANLVDIERFLESTPLTGPTLPSIVQAVTALAQCHDPQRAAHWSQVLLEDATRRKARGWQCAFTTARASASLRMGDLRGAEQFALKALELVPDRRNCTFSFAAVATLIRARTELRDFAAAAAEVYQPTPAKLFQTIHGLHYLRARGRYLVATNQLHAALDDFFEAGRIVASWNLDRPIILPWRTEAAEVLLRLGRPAAVDRLVLQQLSSPDARHPLVRGITLRLRAATSDPKRRVVLLRQAAGELRKCGDRVDLARTLAELGAALSAVEDPLADVTTQQAVGIATECGANLLLEDIRHRSPATRSFEPNLSTPAGSPSALSARLSDSERRVAALAALAYTNREISKLLHVTVSTVEQHLTNVYRKLGIGGRRHLPGNLELCTVDTA